MKMVKYELAVVHKKDLILTMEEDVDSEEVLKIFLVKLHFQWIQRSVKKRSLPASLPNNRQVPVYRMDLQLPVRSSCQLTL